MVTATKPAVKAPEKKTDWVTPVAVVGGGGMLVFGLWFFLSKKGVAAGSKIKAHFAFDYSGPGGTYILQVSLGHIRAFYFDHIEGATWTLGVELAGPDSYALDFTFSLPDFIKAGTYDGEALIRTSEMDWLDYFIKAENKSAVIVSG